MSQFDTVSEEMREAGYMLGPEGIQAYWGGKFKLSYKASQELDRFMKMGREMFAPREQEDDEPEFEIRDRSFERRDCPHFDMGTGGQPMDGDY